ncbi:hypothetical protein Clacol_006476 [Clathrus columnatus]|uniref:TATA-binding protein-associated factor mot1 n=1 Tax=Clathrus columnatus TaxID=1419009 RepID=A0AAV5AJV0_9AGAM|nr:hypothetical protein Clacol_006476 [Clathrus columnatus]
MSSRLDRLLVLLDTGSNSNVRNTAAKQIAQLAVKTVRSDVPDNEWDVKQQSSSSSIRDTEDYGELMAVVGRILPYLHSKNFDTRTAASTALSHICTLLPVWTPIFSNSLQNTPEQLDLSVPPSFPSISVPALLNTPRSSLLLASSGQEYSKPVTIRTPAEMARARKEAMGRLGLDFLSFAGEEDADMDWEKELADSVEPDSPTAADTERASTVELDRLPLSSPGVSTSQLDNSVVHSAINLGDTELQGELSARERNRLKRKRKVRASAFVAGSSANSGALTSNGHSNSGPPGPPPPPKGSGGKYGTVAAGEKGASKVRLTAPSEKQASRVSPEEPSTGVSTEKVVIDPSRGGQVDAHESKDNAKSLTVKEGEWIWEGVRNVLEVDLFSPNWEVRHGAAVGLRDILKTQGAHGGMRFGLNNQENNYFHEKWCNDIASKLLCVSVLDRFGDYVVAPVRETVSQTLASLLLHMPHRSVIHVHETLLQMIKQDFYGDSGKHRSHVWEVRHAGLLGIKYEVAVRNDLISSEDGRHMLSGVVDVAILGLRDLDDDVRAVAASCLLPVASHIVKLLPERLGDILDVLWNCLADMKDDLGSSVGAVMSLLGQLVGFNEVIETLSDPRASNVRLAVVQTLHSFLQVPSLSKDWITDLFLRLLIQNLVIEERNDIRDVSLETWRTAIRVLSDLRTESGAVWLEWIVSPGLVLEWHEIVMTPLGTPIDTSKLYMPTIQSESTERHNVDKAMLNQDFSLVSQELVLKGRVAAAAAISYLINAWPTEDQRQDAMFGGLLRHYIISASMLQRLLTATIVEEWAREAEYQNNPLISSCPFVEDLGQTMLTFLDGSTPDFYHEMALNLNRLFQECVGLVNAFATECKVPTSKIPYLGKTIDITGQGNDPDTFTLAKAHLTVGEHYAKLKTSLGRTKKKELLEERRKAVVVSIAQYETTKGRHDLRVSAAFAAAIVALRVQMPKLTPIIKSLTAGVRSEDNIDLQTRSARAVASVVAHCSRLGTTIPLQKLVKNLCAFLCQDAEFTPTFAEEPSEGILSFKRETAPIGRLKDKDSQSVSDDVVKARLTRRGAHLAFVELSNKFGPDLFQVLPAMWECMCGALLEIYSSGMYVIVLENITLSLAIGNSEQADDQMIDDHQKGQDVIDNLVILDAIVPTFHEKLRSSLSEIFNHLLCAIRSRFAVIRQLAAQALATICDVSIVDTMRFVIDNVLPMLGDPLILTNRQGAIESIYHIVRKLALKALPYVIFLVVPVLGRMSDQNDDIRATATNTFASLVKMVPLEAGLPDPPGFSEELLRKRVSEREFLTQLLDGSKVEQYSMPVPINIELRKYQQEGVNWLAFLAKYQLHGILCDDMGLGKTLQSICILAGKHHERAVRYQETQSLDSVHLPSIVICPPTLTGHWTHEISKYTTNLRPVAYVGPAKERAKLLSMLSQFDVVITSYEVVRNDIANLANLNWHYCILDEGHVIKNAKTKLTKAVKQLQAHHRLILSGTPIQNNVLELWSLFDFLMPGFLGSESSFYERFGKPILSSRDGKASAKNTEAAALALEALHKQVLPFLLRRLKEDVLNDLPPKIIQDYYCELSDVQKQLYDDFSQSHAKNTAEDAVRSSGGGGAVKQQHIFQSLQYLRKLCNHPALVLKNDGDAIDSVFSKLKNDKGDLHDIVHAPKLQALRQLLLDCGIGGSLTGEGLKGDMDDIETSGSGSSGGAFSQHRVLVFCQLKQMLDIIETDLFKKHMPSVTYMRLDGNTDPTKRHAIVQTFNADPSIDVLLLTTHVGGLGLTLTGADTVVFVEHDWNPMKDLQAMDRAHRLGQKKVVNVYRLISKGTLEEKIMGLQRFKLNIASSVITQQNSGLASMDTDLVLDLFQRTDGSDTATKKKERKEAAGSISQKHVLEGLEDLPEEEEYSSLDLADFMGSLGH